MVIYNLVIYKLSARKIRLDISEAFYDVKIACIDNKTFIMIYCICMIKLILNECIIVPNKKKTKIECNNVIYIRRN